MCTLSAHMIPDTRVSFASQCVTAPHSDGVIQIGASPHRLLQHHRRLRDVVMKALPSLHAEQRAALDGLQNTAMIEGRNALPSARNGSTRFDREEASDE
jgi:hypothetical protein